MLAIATAVVALDQLTKWWAERALDDGHVVHVVWTLQLKLVRNPGTAFSLGRSLGPLLGVLAVVVVLILVRVGRMVSNTPTAVALGLVLGGAVGNLIDRIFRAGHGFFGGHVIDFIDLQWWPVFNVADSGIVVGGVLLALVAYRAEQPRTP
jgi:signal peptidase II